MKSSISPAVICSLPLSSAFAADKVHHSSG